MIKTQTKQVIEVSDWDSLVVSTYSRPYNFQQQDDCKPRGTHHLTVPATADDFENDTIPEEVNGEEMGVSFAAWLARTPGSGFNNELFWERNFYPDVQMVANDLHAKGLIAAGDYIIEIDW